MGPRGERGEKGHKGDPAPTILDWEIDRASYQAVPIMSDGTVRPPLALRGLFEQFHEEHEVERKPSVFNACSHASWIEARPLLSAE
jgi:hypothetical protein